MKQKSVGIRIAPFVVGVLCFLLPFVQVSCGGQKIASFTGVQLATGFEFNPNMGGSSNIKVVPAETRAIVALIALVLGILFSISKERIMAILATLAAGVAVGAMILLMIKWNGEFTKNTTAGVSMGYDIGFWLVGLAAVAGLVFSIMRINDKEINAQ